MPDKAILKEYRNLIMTQERMHGSAYNELGDIYGLSARQAKTVVQTVGSELMRRAMLQTISEPDHPSKGTFRLEQFNADPRACLYRMVSTEIRNMERLYGLTSASLEDSLQWLLKKIV